MYSYFHHYLESLMKICKLIEVLLNWEWNKLIPLFPRTSHGEIYYYYGVHFATKAKENNLLTSYSTNSTFVLCGKFVLCVEAILVFVILVQPYNKFIKILWHVLKYFSLFSSHPLWGLWWLAVNSLFSFKFGCHTCLSNSSIMSSLISTKFVSVFVLCMLYKSNNFHAKANILTYSRVNFT